ncbi:hypothetical protein HQ590_04665 [bacterium]|nr:hypothetical protein [bacterium]
MLVLCLSTAPARAQTTPQIALLPWQDGPHWAETTDEILIFDSGHTKRGALDTDIWNWDSYGRIKVGRNNPEPPVVIGYRVYSLTVESELPAINGAFWDLALVAAVPLPLRNDWRLVLTAGAGTANDEHWDNEHALYGIGGVHFARKLAEDSTLHLGLRYSGNALLLPYVPWPYAAWHRHWNDQLDTVLGLPLSTVRWRPLPPLTIEARYRLPADLGGRVDVALHRNWGLFAAFVRSVDAFYIDGTKNDRLFYALQRVSGGVRWSGRTTTVQAGVGYALNHEFTRGDAIDSVNTVADISEKPYAFVKIVGTF